MNKKSKQKMIILLMIFCIILICIFSMVVLKRIKTIDFVDSVDTGKSLEKSIKEYVKGKIIPQNVYYWTQNYEGKVERETLYEELYNICKYLPDLMKDLEKHNNVSEYYYNNKKEINRYLGINNLGEFQKNVDYLKKYDIGGCEIEYCSYDYENNSLKKEQEYWSFGMKLKYINKEEILLNFNVADDSDKTPILIISVP